LLFLVVGGISAFHGAPANFHPEFRAAPFASILLTLQIVPFFLTGFESVPKYAEEASPDLRPKSYMTAIALALGVGAFFYALSIASVAYIAPWQGLLGKRFATAIAFEQALGARWPVELILTIAMFGLFQCFNGNFVASTRLLYAYSRNGSVPPQLGRIHPRFQTPNIAVLVVGAGTAVALFLGDAALVPVTEVASAASAFGWLTACLSFWLVEPGLRFRLIATLGALASLTLVLMKFLPIFPGHFSGWEWLALGIWLAIGFLLRRRS